MRAGVVAGHRPVAVYTGHLYAGRGIELIIDLARQAPEYSFWVVGGYQGDVDRFRVQTADIPNITITGFVSPNRVWDYLCAGDVLLMPYANRVAVSGGGGDTSKFASPMKMFEYMAAGRPILASTLPVLQEVLHHGQNALLLPYDDPQAWVDALRALHADGALADSLGRQARHDVRQYTWERRAKRILDEVARP